MNYQATGTRLVATFLALFICGIALFLLPISHAERSSSPDAAKIPAAQVELDRADLSDLQALSAISGKIIFSSNRIAGILKIFTMNPDGSGITCLMCNGATDPSGTGSADPRVGRNPALSPDGNTIAFVRDDLGEVWLMNSDGANQRTLTTGAQPAWSPDGARIVFTRFIATSPSHNEIFIMNADGTGQTNVTVGPESNVLPTWGAAQPAFPQGRIAFRSLRAGNSEIYVIAPATLAETFQSSAQVNVTNNSAFDSEPDWSPDGRKLAFHSDRDQATTGDVYTLDMNPSPGAVTRLTTEAFSDASPAWSPDGTKIIYVSFRSNYEIIVIDAATGAPITPPPAGNITNNASVDFDVDWGTPRTNAKIVFQRGANSTSDIYTIDPISLVSVLLRKGYHPALSPDGTTIAFADNTAGATNGQIMLMNADGTNPRTLITPRLGFNPTWSPDGLRMAFLRGDFVSTGNTGSGEINVVDMTSGSEGANEVAIPGTIRASRVSWGTNNRLVYQCRSQTGTFFQNPLGICVTGVIPANGQILSNPPTVTIISGANIQDRDPAWSFDATQIAFLSMRDYDQGTASEIYVMDAQGNNVRPLTNASNFKSAPAWAPDGTKVVFSRSGDQGSATANLGIANADGSNASNPVVLTSLAVGDSFPNWGVAAAAAAPASVDLSMEQMTDDSDPVAKGSNYNYNFTILNKSATSATGVQIVFDPIPTNIHYHPIQSNCSMAIDRKVTCIFGNIAGGATTTPNVTFVANQEGDISVKATVSAAETDPVSTNNFKTQTTAIVIPADISLSVVAPAQVAQGSNFFYDLKVTNFGPANAKGVQLESTLPAQVDFVSTAPGPPAVAGGFGCTRAGNKITCDLGDIDESCPTPSGGCSGGGSIRLVKITVKASALAQGASAARNDILIKTTGSLDAATFDNSRSVYTDIVPGPPANDDIQNAVLITGKDGSRTDTNLHATRQIGNFRTDINQPNEPLHDGVMGGKSVWYKWTSPAKGKVVFRTSRQDNLDTLVGVYQQITGLLVPLVSNNDRSSTDRSSRVELSVSQGTVLYVAVDGYGGASGNLTLRWTLTEQRNDLPVTQRITRMTDTNNQEIIGVQLGRGGPLQIILRGENFNVNSRVLVEGDSCMHEDSGLCAPDSGVTTTFGADPTRLEASIPPMYFTRATPLHINVLTGNQLAANTGVIQVAEFDYVDAQPGATASAQSDAPVDLRPPARYALQSVNTTPQPIRFVVRNPLHVIGDTIGQIVGPIFQNIADAWNRERTAAPELPPSTVSNSGVSISVAPAGAAPGLQNVDLKLIPNNASLIGMDHATLANNATIVASTPLVGNDGGTLVGNDGGTLVGNDGGTLVGNDGGTLIQALNLIGNDGGTLVGNDGGTIVYKGGQNSDSIGINLKGNDEPAKVLTFFHPSDIENAGKKATSSLRSGTESIQGGSSPLRRGGLYVFRDAAGGNGQIQIGTATDGNPTLTADISVTQNSFPRTADLGHEVVFAVALDPGLLQFGQTTYTVTESSARLIITVTRSGDISQPAQVDYVTTSDAAPEFGAPAGTADERRDYQPAIGRLFFAAGETEKSFNIYIVDDSYGGSDDAQETFNVVLNNASGAAVKGTGSARVTITDNEASTASTNAIDDPDKFARQQYLDLLTREPNANELATGGASINQCGSDQACIVIKRTDLSYAQFQQYEQAAAFAFRLYRAAYGSNQPFPNPDNSLPDAKKLIGYQKFLPDVMQVLAGANPADAQAKLALDFAWRPELTLRYAEPLAGPEFVDAVLATIKNDLGPDLTSQRSALITLFNQSGGGANGRGAVLYRLADDNLQGNPINNRALIDVERNRAFVATLYSAYLRRDADLSFTGRLQTLNQNNDYRALVDLFVAAPEYRARFGLTTNQTVPAWEAVVLTTSQAEIKTWTSGGRTYAYLKLSFPNVGYRVVNWGQASQSGNNFTGDALVEKFSGASVQAVTTTAGMYDLGVLAPGNYNFTFKNSGTTVKTQAFTVAAPPFPVNPIDDAREFVKQQYRDFLNREADQAGEDFWTDNITKCNDPARRPPGQTVEQCTLRQRETTSGAFFLSPEFQYTGYFVYRMYQGALGRQPKLSEFLPDAQFVGNGIVVNGQLSAAKINQNRADFAAQFVNCTDAAKYRCSEFKAIYDGLNNQQYVDKLFQTTGVNASTADRAALVNGLDANPATETRASVLQKIVDGTVIVGEGNQQFTTTYGQAFYDQQFTRAFVQLEYFGYMKRDPDDGGYAFWLGKLNSFGGDFVASEMVLAFISSPEYRARFGQP